MTHSVHLLTCDERGQAQALWQALMFPVSREAAHSAQQQLLEAPAAVQQALVNEIARVIREHRTPRLEDNPFCVA